MNRHDLKFIVGLILLLALATVFFISGATKLQTIEPFSWSFEEILPMGSKAAAIAARLFIGLEWAIGAWLAAHIFLRRITYKATILLLLLLTAYLINLIIRQGNNGNCGCFGDWLYMKPSAAIWKNIGLIAVTILLWFIHPVRPYRHSAIAGTSLAAIAIALPFLLNPVKVLRQPIKLDSLYTMGHPPPATDLRRGPHIICFFSTTCPHCRKAAEHLQILNRKNPELPLLMVLQGGYNSQQEFLDESKAYTVPHTLLMNSSEFVRLAGQYVPSIYWVRNSVIERKTYYTELDPVAIKAWMKKP